MNGTDTNLPLSARPTIYEEELPGLGRLRLVTVVPESDADLLYSWVREERARFWGMRSLSREEVRDIYLFLDSLETHHAYLMCVDGSPAGIFQTYDPLHDPVGDAYEARAEDTGMHLLLAPATQPVRNFTPTVVAALTRFLLADPAKDRIVAEPDARNAKAIRRFQGCGFEVGPKVQLAEKEAQLVFLTRERFESLGS
jgi:hypothetical protein